MNHYSSVTLNGRLITPMLWVILGLIGLQSSMLSSIVSYFLYEHMNFRGNSFSAVYGAYSLSCLILGFLIPYLSDTFRRRKIFLSAAVLMSVAAYLIILFFGSPQTSVISLVIFLAPSASLTGLFFAYLRDLGWSASNAVIFRSVFSGAWVIGPVLSTYLVDFSSYEILFIALLLVSALLFAILLAMPNPVYSSIKRDAASEKKNIPFHIISLFTIFSILRGVNSISVMATPIIITKTLREPIYISGQLLGICALLEIPMLFIVSRLLKHFDERTMILLGCVVGLMYQYTLVTTESIPLLFAAQVLNAAFISIMNGVGLVWFQNLMPTRAGLATAMYTSTLRVGALVGTPLASFVAINMHNDFRYAGYVACVACVLAFVLLSLPFFGGLSRIDRARDSAA